MEDRNYINHSRRINVSQNHWLNQPTQSREQLIEDIESLNIYGSNIQKKKTRKDEYLEKISTGSLDSSSTLYKKTPKIKTGYTKLGKIKGDGRSIIILNNDIGTDNMKDDF